MNVNMTRLNNQFCAVQERSREFNGKADFESPTENSILLPKVRVRNNFMSLVVEDVLEKQNPPVCPAQTQRFSSWMHKELQMSGKGSLHLLSRVDGVAVKV